MNSLMETCGTMIMGSNTYASFEDGLPNKLALQVVLTSNEILLSTKLKNVIFTNESIADVIEKLKIKGCENILIEGGGKINTSLLNENFIDEMRIIIKPIVIGTIGKNIFDELISVFK